MMFYANILRKFAPYLIPFFIGSFIGTWATMKLYKSARVAELEAAITEVQKQNEKTTNAALEYQRRTQKRERIVYVESDNDRACIVPVEWLQQFNSAIEADNTSEPRR